MLQLLSALTKSWTSKQRDIVWELEARHMQQNLVAKALGISKTVVHKQLRASKYEEYKQTWESFENYLLYMDDLNIEDKLMPIKKYPAYYNVALYRYDHGELEQAINILNRYLELAHEEIQAEDVFLVPIYNLLASVYNKAEDFDNASTAIQKSLYLQEKLPKARAQFVETIKIKAAVYAHENKLDEAIKTLNAALELSENIFDARDPFKISLKNDLASAYSKSGDFEEAISMYRNVVEIAEGNGCLVASAAAKLDISYCYQRQNRNSEAVILAQEALRIFEDWLPRNHKYIQIAYEYISLS
jgi:tetratricopeptide (TPR) repeat protein